MGELILKYLVKRTLKDYNSKQDSGKSRKICAEIGFDAEIVPLVKWTVLLWRRIL
jgi:hypothetical protein